MAGTPLAFLVVALVAPGFAQKVKTGYDKSADFSQYKTYTWAKPQSPVARPLLYETVVNTIDRELAVQGLVRTDKEGDLTLIPAGETEYGSSMAAGTPVLPVYGGPPPDLNATMWAGARTSSGLGPIVAQGRASCWSSSTGPKTGLSGAEWSRKSLTPSRRESHWMQWTKRFQAAQGLSA